MTRRKAKGTFGAPQGVVNTRPTYAPGFSKPQTAAEIMAEANGVKMKRVAVMKVEVAGKAPEFKPVEL